MIAHHSLLVYFSEAGLVVKLVMLLLLAASIASWTLIFERLRFFRSALRGARGFNNQFWSDTNLEKLYHETRAAGSDEQGLMSIFNAGFAEFKRFQGKTNIPMDNVKRALAIATTREQQRLDKNLSFLASVGSTAPYVGLFGTVWGIMTSFQALGDVQQATISMVAPGISEALIATAMGLFAAIPAVLAYNRFNNTVTQLITQYEIFQEEFINLLYREVHQ